MDERRDQHLQCQQGYSITVQPLKTDILHSENNLYSYSVLLPSVTGYKEHSRSSSVKDQITIKSCLFLKELKYSKPSQSIVTFRQPLPVPIEHVFERQERGNRRRHVGQSRRPVW